MELLALAVWPMLMATELLEFPGGVLGIALNLEEGGSRRCNFGRL